MVDQRNEYNDGEWYLSGIYSTKEKATQTARDMYPNRPWLYDIQEEEVK